MEDVLKQMRCLMQLRAPLDLEQECLPGASVQATDCVASKCFWQQAFWSTAHCHSYSRLLPEDMQAQHALT